MQESALLEEAPEPAPAACFFPTDPSQMVLTQDEIDRAWLIKNTVREAHGLDDLSDFEYVQFALVERDSLESTLERIHHLQTFREEYGLADSYQEGMNLIHKLVEKTPEFMLCLSYNDEKENLVLVMDIAKMEQKHFKTPDDMRTFVGSTYFMCHFLCPTFHCMRKGCFFVIECEGYDWKKLSMEMRRTLWEQVLNFYPFNVHQIKYFNTGLFANIVMSAMRRIVSSNILNKIQFGCQFPPGRLDSFYALPTREAANQKLIHRIEQALKTRYDNQKHYRLPRQVVDNTTNDAH